MRSIPNILIILAFMAAAGSCRAGLPAGRHETERARLAAEVKAEFLHAWQGYKRYAWGHDGIRPISKTGYDWYAEPLLITPIDALDTMILMGLTEEADSTRELIVNRLSFDRDFFVKNFEVTIRLLGGLLSSYQLTGDNRLLALADDLGRRLLPVFDSPTGIPYADVNLRTGAVRNPLTNACEAGTLLLEFGTLSKLTGKSIYYEKAKRALTEVFRRRSAIGLVGTQIHCETGEWTQDESHLGACIDSYYEYMVKAYRLFGDEDCLHMWEQSIPAINRYLADSSAGGLWYGRCDMNTGKRTRTWWGELEAYFPAVLLLAGDTVRATALQRSGAVMWGRHGLEPEQYDYVAHEAVRPRYLLSPEFGESAYYLYRTTGKSEFLEMGRMVFDSLRAYCRTPAGYAEIASVVTKEKLDRTETYFFAETLKYLYLLFSPPGVLDFDRVTFNTEAHPLRKTR